MTEYPIEIEGARAMIGSAEELVVALDVLYGHHDRAVLEQLRPHLPALVDRPQRLQGLLRVLEPEDQIYLIGALGPALLPAVQTASALRDMLAMLAEERVEEALLRGLGRKGLHALIQTPEQLAGVLEWVYGHCDLVTLDLLDGTFLRHLVRDGYELSLVLDALNRACQVKLLEGLGWEHVVALLHDERDLGQVMRAMPEAVSRQFLGHVPPCKLRRLVRDERDLAAIAGHLAAEELALLRGQLEAADAE